MSFKTFAFASLLLIVIPSMSEAKVIQHAVRNGESLMTISNIYYGTHQKWQKIVEANPGIDPKMIIIGDSINVVVSDDKETVSPPGSVQRPDPKKWRQRNKAEVKPVTIPVTPRKVVEVLPPKKKVKNVEKKKVVKKPTPPPAESRKIVREQKTNNKKNNISYKSETTVNNYYGMNKDKIKKLENYEKLEKAYLKAKSENTDLRKQVIQVNDLAKENKRLRNKLVNAKANLADEFSKQLQAYTDITDAQSKILQEKHRILNQRLWLAKNGNVERCELAFAPGQGFKKEKFYNLVEFLNAKVGKENIFVRPEENRLVIHLSGQAVYGLQSPEIRSQYQKIFAEMSEYLYDLDAQHIYLKGHSRYRQVFDKDRKSRSGSSFMLSQSLAIQDYFVQELGWSPKKFVVSTFGADRQLKNSNRTKRFEMVVDFSGAQGPSRQIAAIDKDVNIRGLVDETMSYIGEPKYADVKVKGNSVEYHLSRDYFWSGNSKDLSDGGKQKLARIMKVMSKVEDVVYQFYWVPGTTDRNETRNRQVAYNQLDSLRDYLVKDLDANKANIETGYKNRLHALRFPASAKDENYNRRLIIKITPMSVSDRPFN